MPAYFNDSQRQATKATRREMEALQQAMNAASSQFYAAPPGAQPAGAPPAGQPPYSQAPQGQPSQEGGADTVDGEFREV